MDCPYHRSIDFIEHNFGMDISEKERVQLTPKLIQSSDIAIIICERIYWPDWLSGLESLDLARIRHWDIPDTPGLGLETTYSIWQDVISHVEELVKEIG